MGSVVRTMYQYLLVLAGCALAAPAADEAPYGPPAPVYKPKPAPYKEPDYKPQPYEYKYGVVDDYSKSAFDKVETQDAYGKVVGSYKVNLPDGAYPGPKPGGYGAPQPAPVYVPKES